MHLPDGRKKRQGSSNCRERHGERRQSRFDSGAVGLQPGRQYEVFAKLGRALIEGEAGAVGGELEEHPTRFSEVYRLEPEAVYYLRRVASSRDHLLACGQLRLVVGQPPGDVVYAAHAPLSPPLVRYLAYIDN